MASTLLEIILSPQISELGETTKLGQTVNFINVLNGYEIAEEKPTPMSYENLGPVSNEVALLNYEQYQDLSQNLNLNYSQGSAPKDTSVGDGFSLYKQEIKIDPITGQEVVLSPLEVVTENASSAYLADYNISNNRHYKYVLFPSETVDETVLGQTEAIVEIAWQGWSITELHPDSTNSNIYTASDTDVWVFSLNVETGEQTQNVLLTEQQTLGQFPRFTQGRQNYITGNVSCLLGKEVLPMNYVNSIQEGGYTEVLPFNTQISSNQRVEMLRAWRTLIASKNPKLLKDRKGQSFLVVLNSSTNKTQENISLLPDTISFSWTQIGSLDNVQITGNLT